MKKSLVIALALMLVLAFASSAMAAQASTVLYGAYTFQDTPTDFVYGSTSAPTSYNGAYEYPYGIYLPNAADPASYRIHSNYAKNTDACASCHSTHTAVGNTLLQWYSVYETCMACHDGTVSTTYDVASGRIGSSTKPAMGGAFDGTGQNASNHNVTGALTISAAPGGSMGYTETVNVNGPQDRWTPTFGCESCHTPHGNGGNARILHPDANFAASWAAKKVTKGYYVQPVTGIVYGTDYPVADTKPLYILEGYPYLSVVKNGATVVTGAYVSNAAGYSKVVGVAVGQRVYGTPALKVEMKIGSYLQPSESVEHISGMNTFCGTCHTDYNTEGIAHTSDALTGTYSKAHRHQVGVAPRYNARINNLPAAGMILENGKLECLTCHVAHGVNEDYWAKTVGETGTYATKYLANTDLVELAGSSALKRLPNMGTCEACHQKAVSNQGYTSSSNTSTSDVLTGSMPNTYGFDARIADIPAADLGWVGNARCLGCHQEYVEGWAETSHASSSHTGATGCGRCHNPGNSLMSTAGGTFATAGVAGSDAGITCESCHGTGKFHVLNPTTSNIFNPSKASVERQTIECGKCHDVFANATAGADSLGLASVSGTTYAGVAKLSLATLETKTGWSLAFRAPNEDPAKFADATQLNATSNHYGGAWGFADSKHFKGTGTSENPNGVVSCNTCHDMHSDKHTGLLKYEYQQICASCHDSGAIAISVEDREAKVAMPTNNWNRHQIEANDFAHSFSFGAPATVASVDIKNVNLESASTDRKTFESNTFHYEWKAANETAGAFGVGSNTNLWRSSQTGGGGIGKKVLAYSDAGKTTRVYNNYEMTWTVTASPAAAAGSFVMVPEGGALEFTNPGTGVIADYAKFAGTYTMHYVVNSNPAVNGDVSFEIVQ